MTGGCATTIIYGNRNNTMTTGNDIEDTRRRKNNNKLLKYVFVVIVCFLLGWVIFLIVHSTKLEYEMAVIVATAPYNNITGDDDYNNIMTINTSNDTLQQIFYVDNNRLFNDVEILKFEFLMQAQTTKFFIANNYDDICPGFTCPTNDTISDCVNEKILSSCTVTNRNYNYNGTITITGGDGDDDEYNNYNWEDIRLNFIISYTSPVCNVTNYPEIFQNYTNGHLDKILDDLQTLNLNIFDIEKSAKIRYNENPN